MSSSRLPGKVLKEIAGKPMLAWVVERARKAQTVHDVVVATTTEPSDDPIAGFCAEMGYACTRGSLNDVLDRYYQTARLYRADVIVRVTADCPLIDPAKLTTWCANFNAPVWILPPTACRRPLDAPTHRIGYRGVLLRCVRTYLA
jgi:spore coat polysaccharide biosynthesis protein SpsF